MLKAIRIIPDLKITHDDWKNNQLFDYDDLVARNIPAVGIPAISNRLIIIDIDTKEGHAHDGREWWANFAKEKELPPTYTVQTPSGGYHFYYRLPPELATVSFKPKKQLAPGVDVVYRGYVQCPPTPGYEAIHGGMSEITFAPVSLLAECSRRLSIVDEEEEDDFEGVHRPLSEHQIVNLKNKIAWVQGNIALTYHEWYQGLVSLKTAVRDPETLEELAIAWTHNLAYNSGDEHKALAVIAEASTLGGIGPGTILGIIKEKMHEKGSSAGVGVMTKQDVIEKSGVQIMINSKTGQVMVAPTDSNIERICSVIPELDVNNLFFDKRMDSYIFQGEQVDEQKIANYLIEKLQCPIRGLGFSNFNRQSFISAISYMMEQRKRDPYIEWLEALQWDGVSRLHRFFPDYVKAEDSAYTERLGVNLFIAFAARGLQPGCKMDNILILEGREGIRKSTLVEVLGGDYYLSLSSDEKLNNVETLRKLHQSAIVEIPELVSLLNKDEESIKAIITTKVDRVRDLFARKAYDRRRGFVFIGTTNNEEYLTEAMGTRRYWPVRVGSDIDIDRVQVDRDQLFAEGVHRYKNGERYWETPPGFQEQIDRRKLTDPLTPAVEEIFLSNVNQWWTVEEIFQSLKFRDLLNSNLDSRKRERIMNAIKAVPGHESKQTYTHGRVRKRAYRINLSKAIDELI